MFYCQDLVYVANIVEIKFDPKMYYYLSNLLRQSRFIPKRYSKYLIGLCLFNEVQYL